MGTNYKISISEPLIRTDHSKLFLTLDFVNQEMSTYIPSSLLSKLNSLPVGIWLEVSNEFIRVVDYSQKLCFLSEGAFDVSVGNLVNAWGFGPLEINFFPNKEIITKEKSQIGCNAIQIDLINKSVRRKKDVYLDLSAVAKGFAIDLLAEYLDKLLVENYLIEIGGELRVKGNKPNGKPWVVGIEHPEQSAKTIFTIDTELIKNFSLATSGNYRNYKKINKKIISHTFDPRSGLSIANKIASVSIIDQSAMKSDALATTLNVLGLSKGLEFANKHQISAFFVLNKEKNFLVFTSKEFDLLIN